MSWPWSELGLDGPSSLEEVRRAYAQRLKKVHPEEDPEGFQRLHTAYQQARQTVRRAQRAGRSPLGGAQEPAAPRPPQPDHEQAGPLDVTALLQQEREQREEQPQKAELDFTALLNQEEVQEEQPRPQETKLDFTALLHQEDPQEEQPQPQEAELDFNTLLSQEETWVEQEEQKEPSQGESWDFQQIFREEDTRREEQKRFGGGQDIFVNRALELLELLFEEECTHQDWERFLTSPVFFRVKWNPRFMAALAETFRVEPVLDKRIREAVCLAYGLRPGQVPPEHRNFYTAVSGRVEPAAKQQQARFSKRHPLLYVMVIFMAFIGAGLHFWMMIRLGIYLYEMPERRMVNRLCQYIQEDFGYPVESRYGGHLTSTKLFYLPVQRMSFTAWPEGERDLEQGQLGYETDLGNRLLTQEMEAFAEEWSDVCELELVSGEEDWSSREVPEIYEISTGLKGGTDCLAALGEKMDLLSQETWYSLWFPQFQIQIDAWNAPYFTYTSSDGPFPAEEILSVYQEEVPVKLVSYLVEESGLAQMDFGDGAYHMEDLGTITLRGDNYVLMGGVEETTGETTRLYLYNNMYLISTPAAGFDPNMGSLEYSHLLMGDRIPEQGDDLPWPWIGIYRN